MEPIQSASGSESPSLQQRPPAPGAPACGASPDDLPEIEWNFPKYLMDIKPGEWLCLLDYEYARSCRPIVEEVLQVRRRTPEPREVGTCPERRGKFAFSVFLANQFPEFPSQPWFAIARDLRHVRLRRLGFDLDRNPFAGPPIRFHDPNIFCDAIACGDLSLNSSTLDARRLGILEINFTRGPKQIQDCFKRWLDDRLEERKQTLLWFVPGDIRNLSTLVEIFRNRVPGGAPDFVWSRLSTATRELLMQDGASLIQLRATLADELNRLVESDPFYEQPCFSHAVQFGPVHTLTASKPQGPDVKPLHRMLLELVFSPCITTAQIRNALSPADGSGVRASAGKKGNSREGEKWIKALGALRLLMHFDEKWKKAFEYAKQQNNGRSLYSEGQGSWDRARDDGMALFGKMLFGWKHSAYPCFPIGPKDLDPHAPKTPLTKGLPRPAQASKKRRERKRFNPDLLSYRELMRICQS